MMSLNIQLHSFQFAQGLINGSEKIRVSITTLPEKQKQAYEFDTKKMSVAHSSFNINISEITSEIVIVFRKTSLFSRDQLFASTKIISNEFPSLISNVNNLNMKEMMIYEPIQHLPNNASQANRKVVGRMCAMFYLSGKIGNQSNVTCKQLSSKNSQQHSNSKIESILSNEHGMHDALFRNLISN